MGLMGSVLGFGGGREAGKFNKEQKKMQTAALGELTPEKMQHLIQLLFSKYYGMMAPGMQAAGRGIQAGAARSGLTGAGVTQQLSAGVPGQFSNMAMGQAIGSALPIASQRANLQMARQYQPVQTNWHEQMNTAKKFFGNMFSSGF